MRNIDKLKIKNWVVGDTFAWKIRSNKYPRYNNHYILFTVIDKPKTWDVKRTNRAMISKITHDSVLPKNQKEYDELETIKLTFADPVELAHRLYEVKYDAKPDEYDYVYGYIFEMWIPKYCFSADMIYIGNFAFNEPTDSFLPQKQYFGLSFVLFDKNFKCEIDSIINSYELINLRKSINFSKEYLENRESIRQDNIEFMNHLKELSKRIREEQEKNPSTENSKRHRDTLTYVGPDREENNKMYNI